MSHPRNKPSAIRCAMRSLLDPSLVDGAGPDSRSRFAQRRNGRAAKHLLDVIITMSTDR